MQWPSAVELIATIAIIVAVSLIAGIVETWREERKREKEVYNARSRNSQFR